MDTPSDSFWVSFPKILEIAVKSSWMSINVRTGGHPDVSLDHVVKTTQAKYEQQKAVFEWTNIVQIGFTFGRVDEDTCVYNTETFQFTISPMFPPDEADISRALHRTFSMSVKGCDKLRKTQFPLEAAIYNGESYLSQEEEFRLQKILFAKAHDEHPGREDAEHLRIMEKLSSIYRCVGIRYLIDALAGVPFANKIDPAWCHNRISKKRLCEIEEILRDQRPILVRYDIFNSLALVYKLFAGELPKAVEEFQIAIHQLFPRVVDTKFVQDTLQPMAGTMRYLEDHYWNTGKPVIKTRYHVYYYAHTAGRQNLSPAFRSYLDLWLFLKQTYGLKAFWYKTRHDATAERLPISQSEHPPSLQTDESRPPVQDSSIELSSLASPGKSSVSLRSDDTPFFEPTLDEDDTPVETHPSEAHDLIPPWSSPIWRRCGNKTLLRDAGVLEFKDTMVVTEEDSGSYCPPC